MELEVSYERIGGNIAVPEGDRNFIGRPTVNSSGPLGLSESETPINEHTPAGPRPP